MHHTLIILRLLPGGINKIDVDIVPRSILRPIILMVALRDVVKSGWGSTVMITQQLSAGITVARPSTLLSKRRTASDHAVRLIQASLAVYLLPVLLIVVVVGAIGMLILGMSQMLTVPARRFLG